MIAPTLIRAVDGPVTTLTLNRPETKNALTRDLVKTLADTVSLLGESDDVRVIVLTGAGGAFCSGADLKASIENPDAMDRVGEALAEYHRLIKAVVSAPKPVIAKVDGPAVGFGCDLALACDLRVLSDRAYLQEKFVRIGLMPDGGGTLWLTRMIGIGRALELLLTGDPVPAERAYELGLANHVVSVDELDDHTARFAARLAKGPPLAHAAIKRTVRAALASTVDATLALEKKGQLACLKSEDFVEGVNAWMQKRAPTFVGK